MVSRACKLIELVEWSTKIRSKPVASVEKPKAEGSWTEKQDVWGFDLTSFKSADDWKKVLLSVGINNTAAVLDKNRSAWIWKADGITIATGNDPITGEYNHGLGSGYPNPRRVGFASYIGIEGDAKLVKKAADMIRKLTDDIKEETPHDNGFI